MNTIKTAAAAVLGARHARIARNGQDAAVSVGMAGGAVVVVCDGCSSGASSEVGARLGASLFARALVRRIGACGEQAVADPALWDATRGEVASVLADLLERMAGDRVDAIHDHLLFTIVAAAMTRDAGAVWALGDGGYALGAATCELGPFVDNEPPYLAYDLLGEPREAHFMPTAADSIVIATDGAPASELARFAAPHYVDHPDALRRELAILARAQERIDWDARRVVRTPAPLQDDCAVAVLRRAS